MTEKNEHDVVVIGSGQNGLSAAVYLAKAGLDVVILEAKDVIGGNVLTQELTVPGFKHDVASTMVNYALANPIIAQDELGLKSKYGLELITTTEPSITTIYDDGTTMHNYCSIDKTCDEIAEYSQHDADAYRKFIDYLNPMLPLLSAGMFSAPPRMGLFLNQLDQSPVGQEMLKLLFMSAWNLATQWFEHPKTLLHMVNYPTEAMVNPEEGGSAYYLVAMVPGQHIPGADAAFPRGGVGNLIQSLVRCFEANGGEILTNHEVVKITTKGGRATGVVCANGEVHTARKAVMAMVDPRLSLLGWLDTPLSTDLQGKISRITEPAFSGIMTHTALTEEPKFKVGGDSDKSALIEMLPSSLYEYRKYFDDLKYKILPQPKRYVNTLLTKLDPTRAPEGKSVLYSWQYVPYNLADGGYQKWDSIKKDVSDRLLEDFFSKTTNLSWGSVLGREVISPLDYARFNKNNLNGSILGPAPYLYQNLGFRPVPELGQYRTPVDGLYQGGASSHPGGGITLGGRAVVQVVMQDLGIDFDDVVS